MARLLILPALWHVMACPRQRMAATEQTQYMRGPSSFRRPLVFLLSNTSHLSTTYLCFNHFTHHPISLYLSDCTCRLSNQKLLSLSLFLSCVHVSRTHYAEECLYEYEKHKPGARLVHICFQRAMHIFDSAGLTCAYSELPFRLGMLRCI